MQKFARLKAFPLMHPARASRLCRKSRIDTILLPGPSATQSWSYLEHRSLTVCAAERRGAIQVACPVPHQTRPRVSAYSSISHGNPPLWCGSCPRVRSVPRGAGRLGRRGGGKQSRQERTNYPPGLGGKSRSRYRNLAETACYSRAAALRAMRSNPLSLASLCSCSRPEWAALAFPAFRSISSSARRASSW